LAYFPLGNNAEMRYTIITAKEKQFNLKENKMIEETLTELINAIDNLADKSLEVQFNEQTDTILDIIGSSLYRIADTLEKIEAKMK
jgi:hypothetical protein